MTSKVNRKTGTLTPCRSETPENFITKIGHIDYVAEANTHAKFYGNRPRGVRPTNSQNITSCDFVYLPFPFLSFPFFSCRRLQQKRMDVSHRSIRQMPFCLFSQGCAFWGWENLNLIFNWFIWKKWKNYNGAYGENLKKFKTVITPVVHKIESLFLVLGYGFRGWAI